MVEKDNFGYKYDEDKFMEEVDQHIRSTYSNHYMGEDKDSQTIDFLASKGIACEYIKGRIVDYIFNFNRGGVKDLTDLKSAAHYLFLLAHFTKQESKDDSK